MSAHAACRSGCSSCCHVAVSLSRAEARLIAQKTGAKLNEGAGAPLDFADPQDVDRIAGTPCPFLTEGHCSIYAHRPFVCRTLVNMDDDPVLCEIISGVNVPVPYAWNVAAAGSICEQNPCGSDPRNSGNRPLSLAHKAASSRIQALLSAFERNKTAPLIPAGTPPHFSPLHGTRTSPRHLYRPAQQ